MTRGLVLFVCATWSFLRSECQPLPEPLRCSACKEIASAIEFEYKQAWSKGAKETIPVGHRMQTNSKKSRKVNYINSEAMALDVIEGACVGVAPRGKFVLEDALGQHKKEELPGAGRALKSFCQTLVEEWEDEIKESVMSGENFLKAHLGVRTKRWLCYRKSKLCTSEELQKSVHVVRNIAPADHTRKPPFTMKEFLWHARLYVNNNLGKAWATAALVGLAFYIMFFSGKRGNNF